MLKNKTLYIYMKGGREPIEGKYRTDLPGDLSLANLMLEERTQE